MFRRRTVLLLLFILLALGFFVNDLAKAHALNLNTAKIGDVEIKLVGPADLERVDGRNPKADEWLKSKEPKMKFRIMAIYADPKEWDAFTADLENGRPAAIKRYALIGSALKLESKKIDQKAWKDEKKTYRGWFSFAVNTTTVTSLLNARFIEKMKAATTPDTYVKFRVDKDSGVFDETDESLSMGTRMSTFLFDKADLLFLAATAVHTGDKIVFLALADEGKELEQRDKTREKALKFRDAFMAANK